MLSSTQPNAKSYDFSSEPHQTAVSAYQLHNQDIPITKTIKYLGPGVNNQDNLRWQIDCMVSEYMTLSNCHTSNRLDTNIMRPKFICPNSPYALANHGIS